MPVSQTEGAVEVGADPYTQTERHKSVFGSDLTAAGILPVQVYLQNHGAEKVLVRASDMALELPDGRRVSHAGASAAASKLESIGGVVGATIAFGIIGMLAASSAEDKARAARLEDYKKKELPDTRLAKGESGHGFVYFIPPDGTKNLTAAVLLVRVVKVDEGSSFVTRLPLTGLGAPQQ
jgi:hypothetical protein